MGEGGGFGWDGVEGKDFLNKIQKVLVTKEKNDTLDFNKIENFIKRWIKEKGQTTEDTYEIDDQWRINVKTLWKPIEK